MKLELRNVSAGVENKKILNDFSLTIHDGEIHAIMGPNGTGKSTLSNVIMGNVKYTLTSGDILLDNESIISLTTDERARKGIFLAMQSPISIEGVKNSELIKTALTSRGEHPKLLEFMKEVKQAFTDLELDTNMMSRSVNLGFSGGERKKNEIVQLKLLKPKCIILDELDSGLDVDSLKLACQNILDYCKKNKDVSLLIITHYPKILSYLKPDYVHMMVDGKIVKTGTLDLAYEIEKSGYHRVNDVGDISHVE